MVGISKITSKGQVTIPKDIREKFNLKKGDKIIFEDINGTIIIKKIHKNSLNSFMNNCKPFDNDTMKILNKLRDEWH